MKESSVRVNVRRLLEFFDERPKDSEGHATAICAVCGEDLGLGLLTHLFESSGRSVDARYPCTQGSKSGKRLDCWIRICQRKQLELYQVEIKNWSAHAIGGRPLRIAAAPEVVSHFMKTRWTTYFSPGAGVAHPALTKVLVKMKPPEEWSFLQPKPLACVWDAIHPEGILDQPFFSVPLPQTTEWGCDRVYFFSMSSYLRGLKEAQIYLRMPQVVERRKWLDGFFVPGLHADQ